MQAGIVTGADCKIVALSPRAMFVRWRARFWVLRQVTDVVRSLI